MTSSSDREQGPVEGSADGMSPADPAAAPGSQVPGSVPGSQGPAQPPEAAGSPVPEEMAGDGTSAVGDPRDPRDASDPTDSAPVDGSADPLGAEPAQIVTRLRPDGAATVEPRTAATEGHIDRAREQPEPTQVPTSASAPSDGGGAAPRTEPGTKADGPAPATPAEPRPADHAGAFTAYRIGDPGRAFERTRPLPAVDRGVVHDTVIDAAVISDAGGTERLILRGASGRGLSHQQYGDPRQDDIAYTISPDGAHLVCVVADGVSSGAWSHLAARIAVEEGSAHVAKLIATADPAELDWHEVLAHLTERITDAAATLPHAAALPVDSPASEVAALMATTIIVGVVAIAPGEDGTHRVTVVRLGDTSGWLLDDEDGWVALGDVKNEGNVIAESATACLPLVPKEPPAVVETALGAGSALLLLTDGVGDPLGSGHGEVGAVLAQQWARPPHPIEFAAQVCFGRKTYDDDRGAIGIWPVES